MIIEFTIFMLNVGNMYKNVLQFNFEYNTLYTKFLAAKGLS